MALGDVMWLTLLTKEFQDAEEGFKSYLSAYFIGAEVNCKISSNGAFKAKERIKEKLIPMWREYYKSLDWEMYN